MKKIKKRYILLSILSLLTIVFFAACDGSYLIKQGYYVVKFQTKAKDIKKILKNPELTSQERTQLNLVLKVKNYAIKKLGLARDDNYKQYVKIKKEYLLDVVSASNKDKFKDYTWSYPFFGSFPYKGFFEREDALKEATRLKTKNLDVLVRKAGAFSTLGFFDDPLYSFMLNYSPHALVSLIIHEQTHATLWIKNQADFNENLAVFVENKGTLQFLEDYYGKNSREYEKAVTNQKEEKIFMKIMNDLYKKLKQLYKKNISLQEKLKEREIIFTQFKKEFKENYHKNFNTKNYQYISKMKMNNAFIRLFMIYSGDLLLFEKVYEKCNKNITKMILLLKKLKENEQDPKKYMEQLLLP